MFEKRARVFEKWHLVSCGARSVQVVVRVLREIGVDDHTLRARECLIVNPDSQS
jgi:hypothetical protein